MSQLEKLVKKGETDSFVWKDDEGVRLLWVTIEYKVAKKSENVDWEFCQTKHSDILDLVVAQYLSPEEIISTIALHVFLAS